MTGIYKITNRLNGKSYIGQSCNVKKRIKEHFSVAANKDKIPECLIDRAIRKYGANNFICEIIEECHLEHLNEREIYWIEFFDTFNRDKGYNLTLGGDGKCKYNRNEIQKLWDLGFSEKEIFEQLKMKSQYALSQILIVELGIDKKLIKERADKRRNKKVQKYSLDGKYIETYSSAQEAALSCSGLANSIQKVCIQWNKFKSAYGFLWKYEDDERDIKEWVDKYNNCSNRKKEVYQYSKDLMFINKYTDAGEASKSTGTNRNKIGEVCRGTRKTAGGFIWSYAPLY